MLRILTAEQMRAADRFTIDKLGISHEELIDRAGNAMFEEIDKLFRGGRVLVCVGKGNNGADGLVVADLLSKKHGFSVSVLNVANGFFKLFDGKYDIIIDCIFGTGLNRAVEGKYKLAIEKINSSGAFVISCDVPSGLNGNNGKVMGSAVKANLTIAIQEYKLGHFLNDGPDYCGKVVAKDIGISIWEDEYVKMLTHSSVAPYFKQRQRNVHKGDFGKVAVIGGSKDFSGSILLSANALSAFKMGTGYSYLAVPESLFNAYVGKNPECILTAIKDRDGRMVLDEQSLSKLINCDSIAVGMGMGDSVDTYEIIKYLLNNYKGKLVIDADGVNSLAKYGVEVLKNKKCKVVLTPHIGEFFRLSGIDKNKITEFPIQLSVNFARTYGVTIVLKSATSIITDGGEVFINASGCSGMAKAGSGDVLSGLIAGLLARVQTDDLCETSAAACYIFGKAGEWAEKEQNAFTMTASDIISTLPRVINSL